jgi:histidine triad (HIT) family protein
VSVFSRIIDRELPADIVYEDEQILAFKDINPKAAVHLLIIPKKCWKCLQDIPENELGIISHIAKIVQHLAIEFDIQEGYQLLTNNGATAGQEVFHLHFHLIGAKPLSFR